MYDSKINKLVQKRCNSSAFALELRLFCIILLRWYLCYLHTKTTDSQTETQIWTLKSYFIYAQVGYINYNSRRSSVPNTFKMALYKNVHKYLLFCEKPAFNMRAIRVFNKTSTYQLPILKLKLTTSSPWKDHSEFIRNAQVEPISTANRTQASSSLSAQMFRGINNLHFASFLTKWLQTHSI